MHVLSKRPLQEFIRRHPQAESSLMAWYKLAKLASWHSLVDVRADYPSADLAGEFVVFNIGGNNYRLITAINYRRGIVYVRHVLTHSEYDKEGWKRDEWYRNPPFVR